MSKKKKRPISKKVAHLLQCLERRTNTRLLNKRVLIACEDDKSSPDYFHALLRHYKLSASRVEIVRGGGDSQPLQVVEKAIEYAELAKKSHGTEPFEEVWCVIDGDYGTKITNARKKAIADKNKIRLAISTPCFEYWLLLHFEESAKPTAGCDGTIKYLKKHIRSYDKGKCDFGAFMENVSIAKERAEKLRNATLPGQKYPEEQNPCSELYLLMETLNIS